MIALILITSITQSFDPRGLARDWNNFHGKPIMEVIERYGKPDAIVNINGVTLVGFEDKHRDCRLGFYLKPDQTVRNVLAEGEDCF